MSLNVALEHLATLGIIQPMLFRVEEKYWIKVDNSAVMLTDASCFSDGVELLLASFHVFNVQYPDSLRLVYAFLEKLLKLKSVIKSSIVEDLLRSIM